MDKSMEDAIRYISAEIRENPGARRAAIIEAAAQKFDLDPKQTEFLVNKFILEQ